MRMSMLLKDLSQDIENDLTHIKHFDISTGIINGKLSAIHKDIEMHIQRAETRDFLEIAKLDREAWAQNRNSEYIPDGEHVWRLWTEHALVFCAWEREKLIGAVLAFPTATDRLYCLHKVFVDQPFRGKGIGSALFDAILAACDQIGVDCFLTVDPENESAISLYEKWGFSERNFVRGYYRAAEDRYVLTRRYKTEA